MSRNNFLHVHFVIHTFSSRCHTIIGLLLMNVCIILFILHFLHVPNFTLIIEY